MDGVFELFYSGTLIPTVAPHEMFLPSTVSSGFGAILGRGGRCCGCNDHVPRLGGEYLDDKDNRYSISIQVLLCTNARGMSVI